MEGLRNFLTKTLEEASSASGFIDLSSLNVYTNSVLDYNKSYNNWTKESSLLTRIFVELYRTKIGTETEQRNLIHALLVNGENFADIIKEVPSNSIGFVIKPILYSKSLKSIIDNTFNMVSSNMNNITGKTTTLNTTSITLEEGTIEDQADEICAILTKIIEILPSTGSISSLDDISYSQLGKLLDTIKLNAYRVELTTEDESPKEEVGLFKGLFTDLYDKLKTEYPESTDIIASKQPYEINFENLLSIVESLQKATEGSFISNLQNIVSSEAITIENIETLINTVDSETNQEEIQTLLDQIDELEYTIEIPGDTEEEVNNNKSSIGDALNNNTELDESTKEKIKNLLGIE